METVKCHRRLIHLVPTILFHLQFRFKCAYVTLLYPTFQSVHNVAYCPVIVFSHMEKYGVLCFSRHITLERVNHQTAAVRPRGQLIMSWKTTRNYFRSENLKWLCLFMIFYPGLCHDGIYQRPGNPGRVSLLLKEFTRNARNVKLREKEHHLEDVTDTLKSFLSQAEDALLTKELYPYWVTALGMWVDVLQQICCRINRRRRVFAVCSRFYAP